MIPAFSAAIFAVVSPSCFVWSRLMWVMPVTTGVTAVVESSRPPSPVSSTATSTAWSAK